MFLDDKLLEICKEKKIETYEDVAKIHKKIMNECFDYYLLKAKNLTSRNEIKATIDKTIKLFNSFVEKATKDENAEIRLVAAVCKEYSLKKQLLSNKKLKQLYDLL